MLFMYIHTHSVEKCIADKPQEVGKLLSKLGEEAKKAGVKIIGNYVAAHEHTVYAICEADDVVKLERALLPMTIWGDARLIPITTAEQMAAAAR
jgi:uncharacterized protein with GYD domain